MSTAAVRPPDWRVCFYNLADLNPPTLASMNVELTGLLHGKRVSFETAPCLADTSSVIYVVLRKGGLPDEVDVLGRAPLARGRVLPVLEVYVDPVVSLVGDTRSSETIGRALARVAAHEVRHFVNQETVHSGGGLMQSGFSGRDLAREDSYPFRRMRVRTRR